MVTATTTATTTTATATAAFSKRGYLKILGGNRAHIWALASRENKTFLVKSELSNSFLQRDNQNLVSKIENPPKKFAKTVI